MIRILAARTRRFAAAIEALSLRSVLERLASFLIREHEREGHTTIELGATREELAAHLGTVREEVSRALSHLKCLGIIDVDGRTVHLLRSDRLRELAEQQ